VENLPKKTENDDSPGGNGELECEEAIMNDKERFGRARTSLMRNLREKYGNEVADKTLARINKRISEDSLRIKSHLGTTP